MCQEKEYDCRNEIERLVEVCQTFFKVVEVDGQQFRPSLALCAGCPELCLGRGWECCYKPDTTECAYPEELIEKATALRDEAERAPLRTRGAIEAEMATIRRHPALAQPDVSIFDNKNLALIQIDLKARVAALEWILGADEKAIKAMYCDTWREKKD